METGLDTHWATGRGPTTPSATWTHTRKWRCERAWPDTRSTLFKKLVAGTDGRKFTWCFARCSSYTLRKTVEKSLCGNNRSFCHDAEEVTPLGDRVSPRPCVSTAVSDFPQKAYFGSLRKGTLSMVGILRVKFRNCAQVHKAAQQGLNGPLCPSTADCPAAGFQGLPTFPLSAPHAKSRLITVCHREALAEVPAHMCSWGTQTSWSGTEARSLIGLPAAALEQPEDLGRTMTALSLCSL